MNLFYDTETCGLHGPIVLIQYAYDDGPIKLYNPWLNSIDDTICLIESFMPHTNIGFNLAFDHFHLCQMYTTLLELNKIVDGSLILADYVREYAECESAAREGPCLKPKAALDLMLHARKGPYQSTMERSDIRIRKVPTALAWELAAELEYRIPLKDIYFARYADKTRKRWQVYDITDDIEEVDPDFKDVCLKFAPSSGLKALACDALGYDDAIVFAEVMLEKNYMPKEVGYAPYYRGGDFEWPLYITKHYRHWEYNEKARQYATDDVKYTRELYYHFDSPTEDDDDSVLACMVGAVRWHGIPIDVPALTKLRDAAVERTVGPYNFNSTRVVKLYLKEKMSEVEQIALRVQGKESTKGIILEQIAKWKDSAVCLKCEGMGCQHCDEGIVEGDDPHPAAARALEILEYRRAGKEIELYDKLLLAGRFHPSFKVIGTLSSRMSGSDGLNAQGIKRTTEVRSCFIFSFDDYVGCGGDFDGFEVTLMDAEYGDPKLREQLLSGKKIHGLAGVFFFPPMTYEEILATKGLPGEKDRYGRAKNGVFALFYGGEGYTLQTRVGISEAIAEEAYQKWCEEYEVWAERRKEIFARFCPMRQPGGIGSAVVWGDPDEYIESMYGFRRFFTLENSIVKALFELAQDPPAHWKDIKLKVVRRDRTQTATGASQSACFAAAFQLQAANMRAAANHVIQCSGGQLTKKLQRELWDIQPHGANEFRILPFNVHDEINAPTKKEYVDDTTQVVTRFLERERERVPLIEMEWNTGMVTWGDK